jgi:hypothetical protein
MGLTLNNKKLLQLLKEHLGTLEGKRILVLGERSGGFTHYLLEQEKADAYGLDRVADLEYAPKSLASLRRRFFKTDARNLDALFRNNSLDAIVSNAVMGGVGLAWGRYPRLLEKIETEKTLGWHAMYSKLALSAYRKDALPIHKLIFRKLRPGGFSIHTNYVDEERDILFSESEIKNIGFKVLHHKAEEPEEVVLQKPR